MIFVGLLDLRSYCYSKLTLSVFSNNNMHVFAVVELSRNEKNPYLTFHQSHNVCTKTRSSGNQPMMSQRVLRAHIGKWHTGQVCRTLTLFYLWKLSLSFSLSLQATGVTLTITDFHTIPTAYLHFELIFQPSCTVGRPIPTARRNKSCYEKDLICASAAVIYNRLRRMRPLEQRRR